MSTRSPQPALRRGFRSALPYWKHLRLPFQLTIAPLFLWGFILADGDMGARFLMAFLSLHLFIYPGITAFNSAFDRDEGPVSGMLRPPPAPRGLLGLSLAFQVTGLLLAAVAGIAFLTVCIAIAILAAAYSHPLTRWKASPWGSAATVALGQGALGFAAGWCAASAGWQGLDSTPAQLGAFGSALTTLGLYPSTQVFQLDEDAARGDMTLALVLGPARAVAFGAVCLGIGGTITAALAFRKFGPVDSALVGTAYLLAVWCQFRFARSLALRCPERTEVYRAAMRSGGVATAGFLIFLVYRLAAGVLRG